MGLFTHIAATPIGLDIGSRAIKAVQRRGGRVLTASLPRVTAEATPAAPVAVTFAEAKRLRAVLSRRGFSGRSVVVAAPKRSTLTSVLELPPRKNGVPIDLIARTELALAHRREPEGMEVVSWELPKAGRLGDGLTMLAAGCPHDAADAVIEPLEQAGLRVEGMDLEAWAMARVCGPRNATGAGITAVVDLGWTTGTLVLLNEGSVVYERQIATAGVGSLVNSLQKEHGFASEAIDYMLFEIGFEAESRGQSDDWRLLMKARGQLEAHFDALGKELGLSVRYAQHEYPHAGVDRVVLSGGGATVAGLTKFLTPLLDVRVEIGTLGDALGIPEIPGTPGSPGASAAESTTASPALVVAAGLSLWTREEVARCAA